MNLKDYVAEAIRISPSSAAVHLMSDTDLDTFTWRYDSYDEFFRDVEKCCYQRMVYSEAEQYLDTVILDVQSEEDVKPLDNWRRVRIAGTRYGYARRNEFGAVGIQELLSSKLVRTMKPKEDEGRFEEKTKKRMVLDVIEHAMNPFLLEVHSIILGLGDLKLYEIYKKHYYELQGVLDYLHILCHESPNQRLTGNEITGFFRSRNLESELKMVFLGDKLDLQPDEGGYTFMEICRLIHGSIRVRFFGEAHIFGVSYGGKPMFSPNNPIDHWRYTHPIMASALPPFVLDENKLEC